MELDDFGGVAGGTVGGLVSWLRSPQGGWKALARLTLSGLICGTTAFFVVMWKFSDVPWGVNIGISALAGVASSAIIELFLSLVDKCSTVVKKLLDSWLAHLERRHGPPADAGPTTAAPAPAAPVQSGLDAGHVQPVAGCQLRAKGGAVGPDDKAGGGNEATG